MRRVKKEIGDTTALYGLFTRPCTLASHLRGTDIFLDMLLDDQFVHDLLDYCYKAACKMAEYFIDAGMDVIAVVDPLISQISTEHFEEFCSEPFTKLFDHIREKGAYSSFSVCGDATRNIEVMCKTGCDSISVDENVNFKPAKEICDKYSVAFGGNIPLTTIMLHGTQMDNMKYCVDLIDSIENKNGLIVATGCDMPYGVPFENTIGCMQAVLQTNEVREMVKDYVAEDDNDIEVELPDYEHLTKPLVEAFTLDPATCAACTYMVAATDEAKRTFGDAIDYNVYKYTVKEDIARTKKMGVPNLPSVYINGKLKFQSIIPSKEELEALAEVCLRHDIYIVADEIYYRLCYDGRKFTSVAALGEEVKKHTIIINGVSKSYSMTGWRCGFAACGDKRIAKVMTNCLSHALGNIGAMNQMRAVMMTSVTRR